MSVGSDAEHAKDKRCAAPTSLITDLGDDWSSVLLLLFLYSLQGIPLGLAGCLPYVLQERKIGFTQQAIFSFVSWPFSLKLLWAPIVDSFYFPSVGRRKSWLVPIQLCMGVLLLVLSMHFDELLPEKGVPNVTALMWIFLSLYTLAATQDIAVDGWALTMLSRRNVGYASTCNTIGQTLGYLPPFIVFLALSSAEFCNNFREVPGTTGVLTQQGFMRFCGAMFIVSTVILAVFKKEKPDEGDNDDTTVAGAYSLMYNLLKLKPMLKLSALLLTAKVGVAAADSITSLKLVQRGMSKDQMGILVLGIAPINIAITALISRLTAGPRPLSMFYLNAYPLRLLFGIIFPLMVWSAPPEMHMRSFYFVSLVVFLVLHQVAMNVMFVSQMAFFARVSDPRMGGTAMTLLNTVTNLGGAWPNTVALALVDQLTWQECRGATGSCATPEASALCTQAQGECVSVIDGYYVLCAISTVLGLAWWLYVRKRAQRLEALPESEWRLSRPDKTG
eukprot:NODE_1503_length_1706_cov_66.077701_g1425_i0.p1 GENE.NODE_1503_length_1706_cov_66.077701_g1425_i0~~NODE_1503_length_1706_cov_66.077701_g1425_i0.p1  ORF type:complete len:539 (-),score=76.69 NODE_1503_length_1706_cov_66.077701_g1425_i0:88-1596(-)